MYRSAGVVKDSRLGPRPGQLAQALAEMAVAALQKLEDERRSQRKQEEDDERGDEEPERFFRYGQSQPLRQGRRQAKRAGERRPSILLTRSAERRNEIARSTSTEVRRPIATGHLMHAKGAAR